MVKVVSAVRAQIPSMVEAFRHRRSLAGNRDIETLMRLADTLAVGRPVAPTRRPCDRFRAVRRDGRSAQR